MYRNKHMSKIALGRKNFLPKANLCCQIFAILCLDWGFLNFLTVLSQSCPEWSIPAFLSWHSCPGIPVQAFALQSCPVRPFRCHVLADKSWQSCLSHLVLAVLCWLSYPGYPVLAVLSWLFCQYYVLACSFCPVWHAGPCCSILASLSW